MAELFIDGMYFRSLSALAKHTMVNYDLLKSRLWAGWTLENAVRTPKKIRPITVQGIFFPSLSAACQHFGMKNGIVRGRLNVGWSIEEAFEIVVRSNSRSDTDIGHLYLIRNSINDKVYVGSTVKELHLRFIGHVKDSRNGAMMRVSQAIRDIGVEYFWIELVGHYPISELGDAEIRLIKELNTIETGYNERLFSNPKYQGGKQIEYNNTTYPSIAALAKAFGLTESAAKHRIKSSIPLEESKGKLRRIQVEVLGNRFNNLTELATTYGLSRYLVADRYRRGIRGIGLLTPPSRGRAPSVQVEGDRE